MHMKRAHVSQVLVTLLLIPVRSGRSAVPWDAVTALTRIELASLAEAAGVGSPAG